MSFYHQQNTGVVIGGTPFKSRMTNRAFNRMDADALDYFARAEALGGSFDLTGIDAAYTESVVKTAISDFCAGCKADAVWDKLTELYLLAGVTFGGVLAKLKYASGGAAALTNNNFVTGDYLAAGAGSGLKGNGTNKALIPSIQTRGDNNQSMSAYVTADGGNGILAGGYVVAPLGNRFFMSESSNLLYFGLATIALNTTRIPSTEYYIFTTRSATDHEAYANGSSYYQQTESRALTAPCNFDLFRYGGGATDYTNARLTFAHIGTGLTDTDATNLSLRVNKLMYDLGTETYVDSGILTAMGLDADVSTYATAVLAAGGNWSPVA